MSETKDVATKKYPFEDWDIDEDKVKWMMAEYEALQEVGSDGLVFAGKTAMWVAYERYLETQEQQPLFVDPLAKHLVGPYGKRLSECMMVAMKGRFDPNDEIGLGFHGHIKYTAARTMLINDAIEDWINSSQDTLPRQVLNLGSGLDTRVFWFQPLKNVEMYIEVDTEAVITFKENALKQLDDDAVIPLCKRKVVTMDFSKDTIACLPTKHDFSTNVPTCWILEGVVMYLTEEAVKQMLKEMTELSPPGSRAIINFFNKFPASDPDILDEIMTAFGWKRTMKTYFGDEKFNYGRYPSGKPANTELGFCIYVKQ